MGSHTLPSKTRQWRRHVFWIQASPNFLPVPCCGTRSYRCQHTFSWPVVKLSAACSVHQGRYTTLIFQALLSISKPILSIFQAHIIDCLLAVKHDSCEEAQSQTTLRCLRAPDSRLCSPLSVLVLPSECEEVSRGVAQALVDGDPLCSIRFDLLSTSPAQDGESDRTKDGFTVRGLQTKSTC
ncbi:hypothetical protein N657DRAFT_398506 [Parathielavia appendiculata]|uniref:Uncharacterized protein n=1 Tax=Parathielavia appendiculata TaxID=2587402 RepID=A0AAN6U1E0_9PEZI|nr:hypothetical protein N657DRAFT_398506 [Parathielavia appendiculata]